MTTGEKLQALRGEMKRRHLAAYIVPTADFHGSEYVGEHFKVREFLSGFTGSAGTLLVMPDMAALWTDGRYFLQAGRELADSGIELMKSGQPGVPTLPEFLGEELVVGDVIGFDGRTVTGAFVEELREKTAEKQIAFYWEEDLADLIWDGRPPLSAEPVWEPELSHAGLSREEKLQKVREEMEVHGADAFLVTALDEVAWLLNLRGNDVRHTPVFLSYLFITKKRTILCAQKDAFSETVCGKLRLAGVTLLPYEAIEEMAASLTAGQRILADEKRVNFRLLQAVPKDVEKINKPSPVALMKAVRTPEEIAHIRSAHEKDGVAVTRFLYWLKSQVGQEEITEREAARKLGEFRAEMEGYLEPSFASIVAYGSHGAVVHYEATAETDAVIEPRGLCLVDSGGQYREGTTDVTRTIVMGAVTAEEKRAYTLVLKGHLRLGAAKFLEGVCGQNLDILARLPLWENGLDYNHGTGHGVGHLLSVHEGPQNVHWRIRRGMDCVPLKEGMVFSNEPGLYAAGKFGVRHENLVLVRKGEKNEHGQFLYLEPLTMVPFDREAIDLALMTAEELTLLNGYHKEVYKTLSPHFTGEALKWLREATAAIQE